MDHNPTPVDKEVMQQRGASYQNSILNNVLQMQLNISSGLGLSIPPICSSGSEPGINQESTDYQPRKH